MRGGLVVQAGRNGGARLFFAAGFAQCVLAQLRGGFGASIVAVLAVADGAHRVAVVERRVIGFADEDGGIRWSC